MPREKPFVTAQFPATSSAAANDEIIDDVHE
jgi:hypothetical protein